MLRAIVTKIGLTIPRAGANFVVSTERDTMQLTYNQDKTVRSHLATLAKEIRAKFSATAYQGDFKNTVTDETFGDRLQVGTQATINGIRYLLVANVLVARQKGGEVSLRVSAWSLSPNTGLPVGTWPVKRTKLAGVKLTPNGFIRRLAGQNNQVDMVQRVATVLNQAKMNLKGDYFGRPVVAERTDRYGENPYDTTESHLLVFGGYENTARKLAR